MAYAAPPTYDPTNVMGRRIVAWFIDIFVPLVIAFAVGWAIFVGRAEKTSGVPSDYCSSIRIEQPGLACIVVNNNAYVETSADARHAFAVGGLIYFIGAANLFLLQGVTGAALGKHMLGLRVVRRRRLDRRLRLERAAHAAARRRSASAAPYPASSPRR